MKSNTKKSGRKRRIKVSRPAKEYLLSHEEVKAMKWNGREIRNAFQTAVTLAEYDALHESNREESNPVNVELSHFQDVVKLSAKFREYMERVGAMQRELSKRRRGMTTRYLHLVRRRSRDRDERKKGFGDVLLVYDGHVASNSNRVDVYLVFVHRPEAHVHVEQPFANRNAKHACEPVGEQR